MTKEEGPAGLIQTAKLGSERVRRLSLRTLLTITGGMAALLAVLDLSAPNPFLAGGFVVILVLAVARVMKDRGTEDRGSAPGTPAAALGERGLPEVFRQGLYLGVTGFGGGLAILSHIEQRLVETKRWIPARHFLEAAALAQSLPGAVATNALALIGLRLAGLPGALVAVVGFVLPSFLMLLLFGILYPYLRNFMAVEGIFRGLNPAVAGLVLATAVRLGGRVALTPDGKPGGWSALWNDRFSFGVVAAAAAAVAVIRIGVVEVVLIAGMLGLLRGATRAFVTKGKIEARWRWLRTRVWDAAHAGAAAMTPPWWKRWHGGEEDDLMGWTPWLLLAVPLLAAGPVAATLLDRLASLGTLTGVFLRAGALTFGGGFVMIPLLEAELVRAHGWLSPQAFADSVALGQVTPGPVVITATFVGYTVAGVVGAILATVSVFVPAFLMVLILGTGVDRFRRNLGLQAFLQGIQPAVVGLLLAAAVALARHGVKSWLGATIAILAFVLMWRYRLSPGRVLGGACVVGIIWAAVAP